MLKIEHNDPQTSARAGILELFHGKVETPFFMPVGTNGFVKTFLPHEIGEMNYDIILSNAYHLYLRPGMDVIEKAGGLHNFVNWKKNILTDSGGFQLFSLSSLNKIEEDGIKFNSHIDGSKHFLSPTDVIDIQKTLGSDIIMILDHCTSAGTDYKKSIKALETTTRWARISKEYSSKVIEKKKQKVFGIIQGNFYKDLRQRSAEEIIKIDFDGYAIGGLSVGETKDNFEDILSFTTPLLPLDKARYLMGVGTPEYILTSVENGIDMFDCVFPTRIARNATALTANGRINFNNNKYKFDFSPLDEECNCYVCSNFSRSYIRHLFKAKEIAAPRMVSFHNIYFMKKLMENIRNAILNDRFLEFKKSFLNKYKNND